MSRKPQRRWPRREPPSRLPLFAPTAPGLEKLCAGELKAIGVSKISPQPGGVGFEGDLAAVYRANLALRTADRVLVRLRDFRVKSWDSLVRQAGRVPWEDWLAPGATLQIEVSLKRSNLKHRGRIAEVVRQAAAARLESRRLAPPRPAGRDDPEPLHLLVRGEGVRATISLDTSGEHLHRRGYRLDSGAAPLRENLAAALLLYCGYDGGKPLLDAMCGAGTLAIEAALIARDLAPGRLRGFALQRSPAHHKRSWSKIRRELEDAARPRTRLPILMLDKRVSALRTAAANAERAGVADDLLIAREDFLRADPPEVERSGLVVANPPYGRRLGKPEQAKALLAAFGARLREAYPRWRCGVVVPRASWIKLLGLEKQRHVVVPHGGQRVSLVCGEVPA